MWKYGHGDAVDVNIIMHLVFHLFAVSGFSTRSSSKGLEPPSFVEPLQDCHVDEGKNITLRAIIAGSLPIKVSWLHNGELEPFTLNRLLAIKEGGFIKTKTYSSTSPSI